MLDRCYNCGYSLEGLPDRHNCPECGMAYDRDVRLITQAVRGPMLFMAFGAFGALVNAARIAASPMAWTVTYRSVLVLLTAGMFVYGWRCFRQRNRAVLFPEHFVLLGRFVSGLGGGAPEAWTAKWTEIGQVDYRMMGGSVVIRDHDGQPMKSVDPDFFGSSSRAREFVRLANERVAANQAKSPASP